MIEMFALFAALFILEGILEIDNLTALRRAAEGLPPPWSRGPEAHAMALGVRVCMAYLLFHAVSYFSRATAGNGHCYLEALGGAMIVLMAAGLIINYMYSGGKGKTGGYQHKQATRKTGLVSFLIADALLSLDTVIAAVAMTTNFALAMTAMVSASFCIMTFHKPLHQWLQLNPRIALIAFVVIGLLGVNLIMQSQGLGIPKYALLLVVFLGLWLDALDKDMHRQRAEARDRKKSKISARTSAVFSGAGSAVETIKPMLKSSAIAEAAAATGAATREENERLTLAEEVVQPAIKHEAYIFGTGYTF